MNSIDNVDIEGKISDFLVEKFKIDKSRKHKVLFMDARKLFLPERIDLIAKYKYIESVDKKIKTDFFYNEYKATIEAFSNGGFYEPGNREKNSFDKFTSTFKKIFKDIKVKGYDINESIIPATRENIIMDGAHRVAIAAYLKMDVPIVKIQNGESNFDYSFFKKRLLAEKYLDDMVFEYAKMKNNIYVICLWPTCSAQQQKEACRHLKKQFKVVYEKDVHFSYNGLENFMVQAYYEQPWIGSLDNGYSGIAKKAELCFKRNRPTRIVVVEEKSVKKIIKAKIEIREKIGIGNHSIHSTDDKEETLRMLSLVLNVNSINFLNCANPYKYKKQTQLIRELKTEIADNGIPINEVLIDSGSVLALYGIRPSEDLDILVGDKYYNEARKHFDLHNKAIGLYGTTLDDLLYNPENFFYYEGVKVISPDRLVVMKKNRAQKRDLEDVSQIKLKLSISSNKQSQMSIFKIKLVKNLNRIKYKIASKLITVLKKIGVYNYIKKIHKG